jgi:hypothetical protein
VLSPFYGCCLGLSKWWSETKSLVQRSKGQRARPPRRAAKAGTFLSFAFVRPPGFNLKKKAHRTGSEEKKKKQHFVRCEESTLPVAHETTAVERAAPCLVATRLPLPPDPLQWKRIKCSRNCKSPLQASSPAHFFYLFREKGIARFY